VAVVRWIGGLFLVAASLAFGVAMPAGASVTNAQIKAALLSPSNLPAGWSVDRGAEGGVSGGGCLGSLRALAKSATENISDAVNYDYDALTFPSLTEVLATSGHRSLSLYREELGILGRCRTASFTEGDTTARGTVRVISPSPLGVKSHEYAFDFQAGPFAIDMDVVYFQVGPYLGELEYAGPSPILAAFEGFATEAATKAEGHSVTPPSWSPPSV
jgi:hypothetical protein